MDEQELLCVEIIKSWVRADVAASIKSKRIYGPSLGVDCVCALKTEKGLKKIDEYCISECTGLNESQNNCAVDNLLADLITTNKSYFVLDEPERLLRHPCPAPLPTLHANTRQRILARNIAEGLP